MSHRFLEEMLKQQLLKGGGSNEESSESESDRSEDASEDSSSDDDEEEDSSADELTEFEATKQYLYPQTIERIRKELRGQKLFVALTFCHYDRDRSHPDDVLANLIVGPMSPAPVEATQSAFLLKSISTDCYRNYSKDFLVRLFNDSLNLLWPDHVQDNAERILLFITEQSDVIIDDAVTALCQQYPRMIHLRCIAHLLGEIKNHIRFIYPKVEQLYEKMKPFLWPLDDEGKDFYPTTKLRKDNYRFMEFCSLMHKNYDKVKAYFRNSQNNVKFKRFKKDYSNMNLNFTGTELQDQFAEIETKYSLLKHVRCFVRRIPKIELVKASLAIGKLHNKLETLANAPTATENDRDIFNQFLELIKQNTGFAKMDAIVKVLTGKEDARNLPDFPAHLTDGDIERFRHAPLGGINRKWCFPAADELIYISPDKYPLEYIDPLSVEKCFGLCDDYKSSQRFFLHVGNK